ncbi:hypothetical protein DK846_13705 [Methanospirillum lacunae]|uniref:Uncharacterized protein n=1 Tax=Methanospirillum lacunae TaxID=668570 RepID=A0A2V2N3C3_9EURY|nr:hypothetical protein DK846_13705 [Methanospirillum lacunae]
MRPVICDFSQVKPEFHASYERPVSERITSDRLTTRQGVCSGTLYNEGAYDLWYLDVVGRGWS